MFEEGVFFAFFKDDRIQEALAYLDYWKDHSFGKAYHILGKCASVGFHFPNVGYDWKNAEKYFELATIHGYVDCWVHAAAHPIPDPETWLRPSDKKPDFYALGWYYSEEDPDLSDQYFKRAWDEYECLDSLYRSSYFPDDASLNILVERGYFFAFPLYYRTLFHPVNNHPQFISLQYNLIYKYGYLKDILLFCRFLVEDAGRLLEACRICGNFQLLLPIDASDCDPFVMSMCVYNLCRQSECQADLETRIKYLQYQNDMSHKTILVLHLAKKHLGPDMARLLGKITWKSRHEHPEWHKRYHSDLTIE